MGDEIAVQPNVFLSGNLSLSSSVEVSSKCCSLTEYLPECKVYTGEVDENIVLPNNLLEIVAFTTCLGLKDIRGDNIVVDNSGEEPRAVLVDFLNPENRTSAIEIDKILNTFKKFKNANTDDISLPFSVRNKTIRFFQTGNSYAKNMVELFYLLQSSDNSGKFIPSPSPVMELNFPFRRCMDKFLSEPNADIKMQSAFIESGTKMISRYNEIKAILSDPSISLDLRNRSIKEKKFLESGLVMLFKIDQISREYFRKQTIGGDLRREIILSLKPNIKINTLEDEEEKQILDTSYRPAIFTFKTYGYNNPLNSLTSKYRSTIGRRYSRLLSSPVKPSDLSKKAIVKPLPSQPHETFMYFS